MLCGCVVGLVSVGIMMLSSLLTFPGQHPREMLEESVVGGVKKNSLRE